MSYKIVYKSNGSPAAGGKLRGKTIFWPDGSTTSGAPFDGMLGGDTQQYKLKYVPPIAPDTPTAEEIAAQEALNTIYALEEAITSRRLREAVLGTETPTGWLETQEALIAVERAKL